MDQKAYREVEDLIRSKLGKSAVVKKAHPLYGDFFLVWRSNALVGVVLMADTEHVPFSVAMDAARFADMVGVKLAVFDGKEFVCKNAEIIGIYEKAGVACAKLAEAQATSGKQ